MIDEKSIEDNTQKAIDKILENGKSTFQEQSQTKPIYNKDLPTPEEMKKDFKESQQADLEANFEAGL